MAVYDWGEDDGIPFMVLELLEGGSLRGMLDAGLRLTPSQATHVGRQVAAALEYAHGRGLVHRDIKPANLLFDEHGIVRVADFGLARALAEASWTEPAGTVLGTARYASPEQGTAGRLDGRADLYALSLVLVESVTGTVLERAGQVDPDDRYPDAPTMAAALDDVARVLPPPGPFTLVGLGETVPDPHPTQVVSQTRDAVFDQDESKAKKPVMAPTRAAAADADRPRTIAPFILGAVLIIAIAGAVFALTRPQSGATVTVPNLKGLTEQTAQNQANRSKLLVSFSHRNADDPKGTVMGQHPDAGFFLGRGGTVNLVISKGPKPVALPAVAGQPAAQAEAALAQALFVPVVQHAFNETVPKDAVVSTSPAGKAPPDSKVTLVVSDGPAPVTVPNVAKKSYADAAAAIQAVRLVPQRSDQYNDTVPAGQVIGTNPTAGSKAPRDSAVVVIVSKGTDVILVPSVTGKTIDAATAAAQAQGLTVAVQGVYSPGKPVKSQSPAAGLPDRRGQVLTLIF
jgi:serine/threonine-protein kinase